MKCGNALTRFRTDSRILQLPRELATLTATTTDVYQRARYPPQVQGPRLANWYSGLMHVKLNEVYDSRVVVQNEVSKEFAEAHDPVCCVCPLTS